MTTKFQTPKVESTEWRDGETLTPGVKIRQGRGWVFLPIDTLREVADQLHDLADSYEDYTA